MRTNDLLRVLAADVAPERPVAAGLAGALLHGAVTLGTTDGAGRATLHRPVKRLAGFGPGGVTE